MGYWYRDRAQPAEPKARFWLDGGTGGVIWSWRAESNRGPAHYEGAPNALPATMPGWFAWRP